MQLSLLNPWWNNKTAIDNDKHIKDLDNFKYIYKSPLLDYNFKTGNIYTLRGPRQIGKTTILKLLIQKLLKSIPPESIFFWSCDNLSNGNELIFMLTEYKEYLESRNQKEMYILLDEITSVQDWQKAIKFVVDNEILKDVCFILTGSNSIDLRKGTERLPGRKGKDSKDFFVLPLDFREYVKLLDPLWYESNKNLKSFKQNDQKLRILFKKYLITGGIPLVINEFEKNNSIPNYIYELYYSWIIGDILKERKNEQTMNELIKSILLTYTTPISWDSLAKRSSIKSHLTVSSYIHSLEDIMALFTCYFFDVGKKDIDFNKNKKIYFMDHFILKIFSKKLNLEVDESKIVEGIVGTHIKKHNILENISFVKVKKETDFHYKNTGYEVKYQNQINKEDFFNKKYFNNLILISKDVYDKNVIPVHSFLFSLLLSTT